MRCPACDLGDLIPSADLGEVPVLSGFTWDTAQAAAAAPRGAMRLACCPVCAHTVNTAFDPALMVYSGQYDNSLHHSPVFAAYAAELAEHLAKRYDLAGRVVLEPGCGKGEFLRQLCAAAGAGGFGYDVTYQGPAEIDGVRFVRDYVRDDDRTVPAFDFLVSRHVLEHLSDPYAFLAGLRTLSADRPVTGYVEVPDARYDLGGPAWGCIYPHVGYFTAASLTALLRRAGYAVLATGTAFRGVFRYAEVTTSGPAAVTARDLPAAQDDLAAIAGIGERHAATVAAWRARIGERIAAGHSVALWGAGARGVAFLNAVDPDRRLAAVVDRNPAKHGRYLPCTAHRVISPDDLPSRGVDTVLLTNAIYRAEIQDQLAALGVDATLWLAAA